jgi:hypothetical protein
MIFFGCSIHQAAGKRWANPPSKLMLDDDRRKPLLDDRGYRAISRRLNLRARAGAGPGRRPWSRLWTISQQSARWLAGAMSSGLAAITFGRKAAPFVEGKHRPRRTGKSVRSVTTRRSIGFLDAATYARDGENRSSDRSCGIRHRSATGNAMIVDTTRLPAGQHRLPCPACDKGPKDSALIRQGEQRRLGRVGLLPLRRRWRHVRHTASASRADAARDTR